MDTGNEGAYHSGTVSTRALICTCEVDVNAAVQLDERRMSGDAPVTIRIQESQHMLRSDMSIIYIHVINSNVWALVTARLALVDGGPGK